MNSLTEVSPMKRRASPGALRQFVARLIREQPVGAAAGRSAPRMVQEYQRSVSREAAKAGRALRLCGVGWL